MFCGTSAFLIRGLSPLYWKALVLSVPALAYLLYLDASGTGSFFRTGVTLDLRLLLFIPGTRRLHLSTVGFLSYISPGPTFLPALFVFHESLPTGQLCSFALIRTALFLYPADSFVFYKRAACHPERRK